MIRIEKGIIFFSSREPEIFFRLSNFYYFRLPNETNCIFSMPMRPSAKGV
jgi:hypothetical protein